MGVSSNAQISMISYKEHTHTHTQNHDPTKGKNKSPEAYPKEMEANELYVKKIQNNHHKDTQQAQENDILAK